MPKETSDNIYNILLELKAEVGGIKAINNHQVGKLNSIEEQTRKTNGRVTKLEDFVIQQLQINSRIEGIYKATQENTKIQIENMVDKTKREIDEFKKTFGDNTDIKKINTENGWKLKLAIWGTLSTIGIIYFTWLFTNTNTLDVKRELINNQIEKK